MAESRSLPDQIAVVTGGARGIGLAIARRLAADGAGLVLFDRDSGAVSRAADVLREKGASVAPYAVDVTVEEATRGAVADVLAVHGRVDILVNNAGIFPHTPFDELTFPEWRRVLATNLDSAFLVTHALYPSMRSRGYGRVVCISSAAVHVGPPEMAHYVASKAGVIGFVRSVAAEAGAHGITVNAITPGFIETPGVVADPAEVALFEQIVAEQAVGRRGLPDDIAACVAYLARPEAGFITGQTINVDGGHRFL